jgi:hypothetical protein
MKNRSLILLILGFLLAKTVSAQGSAGSAMMNPELFQAFSSVISASGYPAQDVAWPGYRLLDANGIMRVLSDVTGPAAPLDQHSTASQLIWTGPWGEAGNFRIQTRFADFGSTCDLNNPNRITDGYTANQLPPPGNYGNGLSQMVQTGPYNSCGTNDQFSQNNFAPLPLTTRAAWMYRVCRRVGAEATSAQIAMMVARIRVPDPTPTPVPGPGNINVAVLTNVAFADGSTVDPAQTYNWCSQISAPTESDYQSLFRAFYPGRTIPQVIDPTRSQYTPSKVSARRTSLSPTALVFTMNLPSTWAQGFISVGGVNQAPQFREHLMALVTESNQYIDSLPQLGSSGWENMENRCLPSPGAPKPNKDQVKALAAWRAMLITMCMDPGWQVL